MAESSDPNKLRPPFPTTPLPTDLPTDQDPSKRWDNIINSATERNELKIRYRDKSNQLTIRSVEPYEIKNGKLFAYDIDKGGIRAFSTHNIEAAIQTDAPYEPRFPVKINSSILSDESL